MGECSVFFTDPSLFSVDPTKAMYRPLVLLTYTVNHAFGGYSPTGYLFANLVLHLGCALLVWALAKVLRRPTYRSAMGSGSVWPVSALHRAGQLCEQSIGKFGRAVSVGRFLLFSHGG